ncbi:MAG: MtrAB system histidine kinase MtrB [Nocardioidaceae bacterium]
MADTVWRALTSPLRAAGYAWLRSLQARVVMSTVLLCTIVIMLVGWMLSHRVADGLVDGKRAASVAEAQAGLRDAQTQLDASDLPGASDHSQLLIALVDSLASRSGNPRAYEIVLVGPLGVGGTSDRLAGQRSSAAVTPASIPASLRTKVEGSDSTWWAFSSLAYQDQPGRVPAVVVGGRLQLATAGQRYALFYLFPMTDQERTLSLVQQGLLSAGFVLTILVAGVAWLVTRQVVTPVRLARRIAERLAAGRLEERMHVRGVDDIARLGVSFNQMAASLQKQIRQLEELSRLQRRFVSDVSHELRTPLTTVRMATEVLHDARANFDPATARSAELLSTELDRFESLLNDLLEISRFDAGAARLEAEPTDLVEVARRVADLYQSLAERHGMVITVVAGPTPCIVEADVRRIERIVRNLVANAISYSRSPTLQIRIAGSESAAALAVRDVGIGLRPGESTLVFNRFWRADPARTRTGGGTGLGLAIAAEDAALHGGWLQAWGEPGHGAQFRLTLPRQLGTEIVRSPLPLVPQDRDTQAVGQAYARVDPAGVDR